MNLLSLDLPPHVYVRMVPQFGVDMAVVGPLSQSQLREVFAHPKLLELAQGDWGHQVMIDLSMGYSPTVEDVFWIVDSWVRNTIKTSKTVALVLSATSLPIVGPVLFSRLTQMANPVTHLFADQPSAVRWLSAQALPNQQSMPTDVDVQNAARAGRLSDALALHRGITGAALGVAIPAFEPVLASVKKLAATYRSASEDLANAATASAAVPSLADAHTSAPKLPAAIPTSAAAPDASASAMAMTEIHSLPTTASDPPPPPPKPGAPHYLATPFSPMLSPLAAPAKAAVSIGDESLAQILESIFRVLLQRTSLFVRVEQLAGAGKSARIAEDGRFWVHLCTTEEAKQQYPIAAVEWLDISGTDLESMLEDSIWGISINAGGVSEMRFSGLQLRTLLQRASTAALSPQPSPQPAPAAAPAREPAPIPAPPIPSALPPTTAPAPPPIPSAPPPPPIAAAPPAPPAPPTAPVAPLNPAPSPPARALPLRARSVAEAHLYMDIRGCEGGSRNQRLEAANDDLISVYECGCGPDKKMTRFEFTVPERPFMGAGLGDGCSEIIGPGDFIEYADRITKILPASADGLSGDQIQACISLMSKAVMCIEEIVRFVPPGTDRVPESAFNDATNLAAYRREPGRFSKLRLEAVAEAYRGILKRYIAASQS